MISEHYDTVRLGDRDELRETRSCFEPFSKLGSPVTTRGKENQTDPAIRHVGNRRWGELDVGAFKVLR